MNDLFQNYRRASLTREDTLACCSQTGESILNFTDRGVFHPPPHSLTTTPVPFSLHPLQSLLETAGDGLGSSAFHAKQLSTKLLLSTASQQIENNLGLEHSLGHFLLHQKPRELLACSPWPGRIRPLCPQNLVVQPLEDFILVSEIKHLMHAAYKNPGLLHPRTQRGVWIASVIFFPKLKAHGPAVVVRLQPRND